VSFVSFFLFICCNSEELNLKWKLCKFHYCGCRIGYLFNEGRKFPFWSKHHAVKDVEGVEIILGSLQELSEYLVAKQIL